MKIKTRLAFCTSTVAGEDDVVSPSSSSSVSVSSAVSASAFILQSHSSLQTLPSVPSLQSLFLDTSTVTLTYSLASAISLSSPITSLSLSSTSSSTSASSANLYASAGHQINVYDSDTLLLVDSFNVNSPSSGAVKSIAFSKGTVLTAHQDGKIRVWKKTGPLNTGTHKQEATLPTLSDRLLRFPVPKNHVQVRRHKTRLWVEHNDAVSSLAVTNKRIYSVSWDKTLKVWGPNDLRCKESVNASEDAVNAVTVSGDDVVYTGSAEGRIQVWSTKEKRLGLVATLEKHKSAVNALTLNDDGSILFSGACDRSILVWEREDSGKYMSVSGALRGHEGAILCLINVGEFLISGSADRTVRIWRRGGCEGEGKFCCLTVLSGHKKAVKCLAAKLDGEDGISVFSGGLDGEIKVWSIKINRS
ncbi:protein JINGUBANG [Silene latifolia]|uniref:protein JINGUBANG n=1 Tax=Silene latifolia TaxID=37657 RepID=UPI003D76AA5F